MTWRRKPPGLALLNKDDFDSTGRRTALHVDVAVLLRADDHELVASSQRRENFGAIGPALETLVARTAVSPSRAFDDAAALALLGLGDPLGPCRPCRQSEVA